MSEQMRRMVARKLQRKKTSFTAVVKQKREPERVDNFDAMPPETDYAAMAREKNPCPQAWMSDVRLLPKKPPTKSA